MRTVGLNSVHRIAEEEETTVDDDEAVVVDDSGTLHLYFSLSFCEL